MLFIFGGIGMLLAVFVTAIPSLGSKSTSDVLRIIFMINPSFAVAQVDICVPIVALCPV